MLAIGDALALVVSEARGFGMEEFAELHPGGSLGRRLATVDEVMRPITECRVASSKLSIREMLVESAKPGRRSGATMLVDENQRLEGIFTDSDLARLLEQRRDSDLDKCIFEVMTQTFSAIQTGARLSDAIDVMVQRKISELPIVDGDDRPIGLVDITDVLGLEIDISGETRSSPHSESSSQNGWQGEPSSLRLFGPDSFRENS